MTPHLLTLQKLFRIAKKELRPKPLPRSLRLGAMLLLLADLGGFLPDFWHGTTGTSSQASPVAYGVENPVLAASTAVNPPPKTSKSKQVFDLQNRHVYDRYVLNFRREHNFSIMSGVTRGHWKVQRFQDLKDRTFPANGILTRFQYTFHLPLLGGFGYMLGSGGGYHYESPNTRGEFRPVSAWQFPGIILGLVNNFNSIIRLSTTAEAYLERHEGLKTKQKTIFITSNVFDFGAALDIFYDLSFALRLEYHQRELLYEKPFIPDDSVESFEVDAKLGKKDTVWGLGMVYHLI